MIPHGYLVHHGILGQKWGVRRFQNADGTLTSAGKKRYNRELADIGDAEQMTNVSRQRYYRQVSKSKEHPLNSFRTIDTQVAYKKYQNEDQNYRNKITNSIAYKNAIKIAKESTKNNPDNTNANAIISKFYDGKKLTKEDLDYAYKHLDTLGKNHSKAIQKAEKFLDNYFEADASKYETRLSEKGKNAVIRYVEQEGMDGDYATMSHLMDVLENNHKRLPKSVNAY